MLSNQTNTARFEASVTAQPCLDTHSIIILMLLWIRPK